jgi:hypothetical protein
VPELNLVINGDCSGATTAIQNTRAATESMRGLSVMIPVQVGGSAGARNELGRVGAARDAAGGVVALGVDTSGLDAGRGALSDFRGEFQAANRDFASVGGVRSFGLSDDGSVRQLSGDVRALGSGLGATEGTFGRFASSATQSLGQADAGVALLDRSLGGVSAGLDGAAGGLDDLSAPKLKRSPTILPVAVPVAVCRWPPPSTWSTRPGPGSARHGVPAPQLVVSPVGVLAGPVVVPVVPAVALPRRVVPVWAALPAVVVKGTAGAG